MTEFAKYLEGVKIKLDIRSDTQLALRIGVTQAAVQRWMSADRVPEDETCMKIAELSGEDPALVILLAHKSKASEATKKHWAKIFRLVTAATLGLVMFFSTVGSPASESILHNVYYVKSFIRRLRRLLLSPVPAALLLLITLCPLSAKASGLEDRYSWTAGDTAMQAAFLTTLAIDRAQTVAADHSKFEEVGWARNFIGSHPGSGQANRYFAACAVLHTAVAYVLPKPYRTIWQSFWIGVEVGAVNTNVNAGISVRF